MLLVVSKYLKDNWLALNVLNERFGHLHSNLRDRRVRDKNTHNMKGTGLN